MTPVMMRLAEGRFVGAFVGVGYEIILGRRVSIPYSL